MLGARGYKTKKELKASIGKQFSYTETSMFGAEYNPDMQGTCVVGPTPHERKWFAQVWLKNGIIQKVS